MTPEINSTLTKIRKKLEEDTTSLVGIPALGAHADDGGDPEAAEGDELFYDYMTQLVAKLESEYDLSEDEALDAIYDISDQLSEEGDLPPYPDETASDADVLMWTSKANLLGFGDLVCGAVEDALYGDEEDEEDME